MHKILVVDDAAFMRMKVKMALEKAGFEVIGEADNGLEGVSQYMKLKPDLVTLDITMPKLSGIDALKEIRKFDNNAKVLMVSAMGQEGIVKEAVLSGAKTFIVKPFSDEKLVQTVKKILSV